MTRCLVLSTCLLMLLACKNGTLQEELPAVISEPSPASRAELQQLVSTALGGADVVLADDALTQDSVLIVERRPRSDPQGNRLLGRDLGTPEHFQLLLSSGRCVLVQQSSGKRWELQGSSCRPE